MKDTGERHGSYERQAASSLSTVWSAVQPPQEAEPPGEPAEAADAATPTVLTKLQKWGDYEALGKPVWPTKFVPMKTPMSREILANWSLPNPPRHSLTVPQLLEEQAAHGEPVGLIIDLANHECLYYDDIPPSIEYETVQLVLPPPEAINEVEEIARSYWSDHPDKYIAIHCAYGFNRTGFVVCSYLCQACGLTVQQALDSFAAARPPGVKHEKFIAELYARYGGGRAPPSRQASGPPSRPLSRAGSGREEGGAPPPAAAADGGGAATGAESGSSSWLLQPPQQQQLQQQSQQRQSLQQHQQQRGEAVSSLPPVAGGQPRGALDGPTSGRVPAAGDSGILQSSSSTGGAFPPRPPRAPSRQESFASGSGSGYERGDAAAVSVPASRQEGWEPPGSREGSFHGRGEASVCSSPRDAVLSGSPSNNSVVGSSPEDGGGGGRRSRGSRRSSSRGGLSIALGASANGSLASSASLLGGSPPSADASAEQLQQQQSAESLAELTAMAMHLEEARAMRRSTSMGLARALNDDFNENNGTPTVLRPLSARLADTEAAHARAPQLGEAAAAAAAAQHAEEVQELEQRVAAGSQEVFFCAGGGPAPARGGLAAAAGACAAAAAAAAGGAAEAAAGVPQEGAPFCQFAVDGAGAEDAGALAGAQDAGARAAAARDAAAPAAEGEDQERPLSSSASPAPCASSPASQCSWVRGQPQQQRRSATVPLAPPALQRHSAGVVGSPSRLHGGIPLPASAARAGAATPHGSPPLPRPPGHTTHVLRGLHGSGRLPGAASWQVTVEHGPGAAHTPATAVASTPATESSGGLARSSRGMLRSVSADSDNASLGFGVREALLHLHGLAAAGGAAPAPGGRGPQSLAELFRDDSRKDLLELNPDAHLEAVAQGPPESPAVGPLRTAFAATGGAVAAPPELCLPLPGEGAAPRDAGGGQPHGHLANGQRCRMM
eukprot:scaffold13.g324.t1